MRNGLWLAALCVLSAALSAAGGDRPSGHQAGEATPTLIPFSWTEIKAPAFLMECKNTSDQPRRRSAYMPIAHRLDGQVVEPSGWGGSVSGDQPVLPGGIYRVVIVLNPPGSLGGASVGLDMSRLDIPNVSLTSGRHTIAFRCYGAWSEEIPFFLYRRPSESR
jgi:hypothetical protein